jgi:hypothetical protein
MGAQWKAKGKELAANARGKLFGRLAKDIMIAARNGADPASNARLRLVVEQARKVSMPKETLERAIKKGAGLTGESDMARHRDQGTHHGHCGQRQRSGHPILPACGGRDAHTWMSEKRRARVSRCTSALQAGSASAGAPRARRARPSSPASR